MQHLSRIIVPPVVILLLAFAYHYHRDSVSVERAMTKELEYVIEQQAQEIETLKKQIEDGVKIVDQGSVIKKIEKSFKLCPEVIKPEDLPCTATGPTASITVRGYHESNSTNQR